MTNDALVSLVDRLRTETEECEWLEFKAGRVAPERFGQYVSGLANGAALARQSYGYLVLGLDDASRAVVGTKYDPRAEKEKGQDLLHYVSQMLDPYVTVEPMPVAHAGGRVMLVRIGQARGGPVRYDGKAYVRINGSLKPLARYPALEKEIWLRDTDWSAGLIEEATPNDLDPEALAKARAQFIVKHPGQRGEIDTWDDARFLRKAKLMQGKALTRTALLLLGRDESSHFISPAVAQISWFLKGTGGEDLDYEHFFPPFILSVDDVLARIRNLTLRVMPGNSLFPREVQQYDPDVIREALHNALAHQDYTAHARVNVVEFPDRLLITNRGSFLAGSVEQVIERDAPPDDYRNRYLAQAMVALNMIDTQGGGIKKMFRSQAARFLPLPDYDLTDPSRVQVTIPGHILDVHYSRLLMERTDLPLDRVVLLDKVQKRHRLSKDAHALLKREGLIEGRYPTAILAGAIARVVGQEARHIRERGLDLLHYRELILALVRAHGPVPRSQIDELLMDKLPEAFDDKQKKNQIHNLLNQLSKQGLIQNTGTSGPGSRWESGETKRDVSDSESHSRPKKRP